MNNSKENTINFVLDKFSTHQLIQEINQRTVFYGALKHVGYKDIEVLASSLTEELRVRALAGNID